MGRKARSKEEKQKRGETRPSRTSGNSVSSGSYTVMSEMPDPPGRFGEVAAEEWRSRVRDLWDAGHRTAADARLLERWCELIELAEEAYQKVREQGMTFENSRGNLNKNPWYTSYLDACKELGNLSRRFGFSPYDRGLIGKGDKDEEEKPKDDGLLR